MPVPLSLLEELARIPDPRSRRGIRHPLSAIWAPTVLAMLTSCKSYTVITPFGRDKGFALVALAFEDEKWRQAAASPPHTEVPPPADSVACCVDKGHGRIEKRSIRVTTVLTKTQQFKGLKQGFELTRERTEKGRTTVEVVYGITSLSRERADAKQLPELTREHWTIENDSHSL